MQQDNNQELQNANVGFPGATPTPPQKSNKNWKWLLVLVLFLVVIGGVTYFVFKSSRSSSLEESPIPDTSSLTNFATPQPTTAPSTAPVDKSQIKIQVLNGTGIGGEAGILSAELKKLGYTNVTTGNASDQNGTETQVSFGSSVSQDVISEVNGKLMELYTSVKTTTATLTDFDIQVTTGLRKGQTAPTTTPVATPTATPAQ